jgi:peptidoglycan/xylan/chitin deacetylase (PgdA/CDA1 family)
MRADRHRSGTAPRTRLPRRTPTPPPPSTTPSAPSAPTPVAPGAATRAAPSTLLDRLDALRPARAPEWIAMYHSVTRVGDDPYRITVTPERLDDQLGRLRRRGSRAVSMRELMAARARGRARGLVALTFDDGYADFLDHALPVLRRHGCGATLFVLPGRLGGDNAWDPLGVRKPLLTAEGVRAAAAAGVEIGSHGLTHLDLTRVDDAVLRAETRDSLRRLEELTGTEVLGFCYPYGTVDARVVAAVGAAGYRYGCAIAPGALVGDLALPRVHIGQQDTGARWEAKRLLSPWRRPMPGRTVRAPGALPTADAPARTPVRGRRPGVPFGTAARLPAAPRAGATGTATTTVRPESS